MEVDKAKMYKEAARRRARGPSPGDPVPQPSGGERNSKWAFVAGGGLILAFVAFLSGVQMGKALTEFKNSGESFSQVKDRRIQEVPFPPETRGKLSRQSKEGETAISGGADSTKEKGPQPSSSQETKIEEKNSAPPGETASSSVVMNKKEALPSKAKFTLQVAAFNNHEEAQELINRLQKKGYTAYQITGRGAAKGTLHRVRVGHFKSLQEARQFALAFEKKEKIKTIITSLQ